MDADFWRSRWENNQIGFHQSETNKLLMKHWPSVCPDTSAKVFVPLCGKSLDMVWLSDRGHEVLGVELCELAVDSFFAEHGTEPHTEQYEDFIIKSSGRIKIWCGDFFSMKPEHLARVSAVYDRASLIALPPSMRRAYSEYMSRVLPWGATTLLQTITYDQSEMSGPPFSVSDEEVQNLYGSLQDVLHLETRDALAGNPTLQERGITALTTSVYRIVSGKRPLP